MKLTGLLRSRGSLRQALVVRLVLALAMIALVGAGFAAELVNRYANLAYDRALADDISVLASQLELKGDEVRVNLPPVARSWLLSNEGERMLYRVTDLRSGAVLDSNGDLGPWSREGQPLDMPRFSNITLDGTNFRVAAIEHSFASTHVSALVQVGETLGQRRRVVGEILFGSLIVFALMTVAAASVVWTGTRNALQPLELLEVEAAQRSSTDLRPLDPLVAPVEVRGLITAINHLMDRLSRSMQSQSRFIANAAHQLRTPLAGLQLQAQLGLDEAVKAPMRARLTEINRSAGRAVHLVEQLLTLARAEAGGARPPQDSVDLVVVVREVLERHLALARSREIDLGYQGEAASVVVAGNAVLIFEMLANLVDNALRYGRPAGVVTIGLTVAASAATLSVIDDGDGIAESVARDMFGRFNRSDATAPGGSGLGLAIVKEIAELHSAEVSYEELQPNGTRIAVTFPISEPAPS